MAIWSVICSLTFVFALHTRSQDYRTFFGKLLGPLWPIYEIAYLLALILVLAVFAAAAGAIGHALFGAPELVGSLVLVALIAGFATWGNETVERLFKYVSILLYGTYAAFVALSFTQFGDRIAVAFATGWPIGDWVVGGVAYASYNIIGAIVILPVTRHLTSSRDAVVAGVLAGPLAMLPALFFFICMVGFYPAIQNEALPSDFLLEQLNMPGFRILFQLMIFSALLESGVSGVHAINERIAQEYQRKQRRTLSQAARFSITLVVLVGSVFVAGAFGLVALIGQGYRWLAYTFLLIYVAPLLTLGVWRLWRASERGEKAPG